ncbi:hypothetical protein PYW08_011762 [Mythimna loreyi]|uniref:Uncharacterized protein n=1 Tax=Mythimna loreyi TaxID=667449 RepID=A0ACC2QMG2_9NEOP|nr:hypothetical protein PYW08_011762 [Mythimna loreyi]
MFALIFIVSIFEISSADVTPTDVEFLNELPLDKLLVLKNSLQDLVTADYENVTTTTPTYIQTFGAEAMAMQAPPIKRGDYEEALYKKDHHSKITNIFSMSVTTLAFLAFGGYLLCLIVQAVKAKQTYNAAIPTTQPTTFFVSAGIKKKPQTHFSSSYGRRRRDNRFRRSLKMIDLPPEQLFEALLQVCEGYAKWSERTGDIGVY